jgi:4'-phosphopantetheinyl transferase
LPFGLDAFEFELEPNLRVVHAPAEHGGPERFHAYVTEGIGGCAALVTRNPACC